MKPYFFPTILTSLSILPILSCGDLEKEKKKQKERKRNTQGARRYDRELKANAGRIDRGP